ncbi:MAG: hypothetical protein LBT92_01395 [Rickettsiales bacterium]|jgi:hypothetical protein|nr:hypothetical protein [Rickettsiales bacterium]
MIFSKKRNAELAATAELDATADKAAKIVKNFHALLDLFPDAKCQNLLDLAMDENFSLSMTPIDRVYGVSVAEAMRMTAKKTRQYYFELAGRNAERIYPPSRSVSR